MREKAGSEHSFIKIQTIGDYSVLDLAGAGPGQYTLELESYDSAAQGKPVIQADLVTVIVLSSCSIRAE